MNKLTKNGGSSLLLDDEFTFSFFFAGSGLDPSKIYRCYFHKKRYRIDGGIVIFRANRRISKFFNEENGKLNVNTLLVPEGYLDIAR